MPLHDWTDRAGWEGVHILWTTELLRWIKPRLPADYRAYIGTAPVIAIGSPGPRPDVGVHRWEVQEEHSGSPETTGGADPLAAEPDEEVAVAALEPGTGVYVERKGRLVAAVELISPRNKDRPVSRDTYLTRYAGYLLEGVHLLLVDVHRRPLRFSFADRIAEELGIGQPSCPPPLAIAYRVGEPAATGGRLLAIWRRLLESGQSLPTIPLPLDVDLSVAVDLEITYQKAAEDAYLA